MTQSRDIQAYTVDWCLYRLRLKKKKQVLRTMLGAKHKASTQKILHILEKESERGDWISQRGRPKEGTRDNV